MTWEGLTSAAVQDPQGVGTVLSIPLPISQTRLMQKPSVQSELAWVIEIESSWVPSIQNPKSKATGLIQFLPSTAAKLGTTVEDLKKMSRAQQAPYVSKYFFMAAEGRLCTEVGDLYMLVAAPGAFSREAYHIVYPVGSPGWRDNPTWRLPGDGPCTVGSIRRRGVPPGELPPDLGVPKGKGGGVPLPPVPTLTGGGDLGGFALLALAWLWNESRKKNARGRRSRQWRFT